MSYQATVFNVMIASPSDVSTEREQIRAVIHEWNAIHSAARRIVLLPLGWETHASPQMGNAPQSIINEQVLAKADLVVGVFWTRIGTKTDEYDSGTVEEIERHIASGRPAMLYFSSSPVEIDSVDPDQYAKLKVFKDSCRPRGLYEPYASIAEFRASFNRHLQLKINEHPLFGLKTNDSSDGASIVERPAPVVTLSEHASTLLKEVAQDKIGQILHMVHLSGTAIQTNGKQMIQSGEPRVVAAWEAALDSLVREGFVEDRGHKGEVFRITSSGYEAADRL